MKNICRQSAALILLRQAKEDFKVLLVKRNPNISFASSWAFPGGAAEKNDFEQANHHSEIIEKCHAKFYNKLFTSWYPTSLICALRETQEETGIKLDLNHYIMNSQPILRLITPQHIQKRYDTQFFVYNLSSTDVDDSLWDEIKIDNTECIDYLWETPKYFIEKFLEGKIMLFPPIFLQLFALKELGTIKNVYDYIEKVNKENQYNVTFPFIFQFKQIKDSNSLHIIQYPDQLFDRKGVINNETNVILRTELERRIEYSKKEIRFRFIQQEDENNFRFEGQVDLPYYSLLSCLQNLKVHNQREQKQLPKL